jgi:hypothetical protein
MTENCHNQDSMSNIFVVPSFDYCTMVYEFLSLCYVQQEILRSGLLEILSLATISIIVHFIISYCRYMFRPLFDHLQAEYTRIFLFRYSTIFWSNKD